MKCHEMKPFEQLYHINHVRPKSDSQICIWMWALSSCKASNSNEIFNLNIIMDYIISLISNRVIKTARYMLYINRNWRNAGQLFFFKKKNYICIVVWHVHFPFYLKCYSCRIKIALNISYSVGIFRSVELENADSNHWLVSNWMFFHFFLSINWISNRSIE